MSGEIAGIEAVDAVGALSVEVDLLQNAGVRSGAVMEQIQQVETGGVLMGGETPLVPGELKGKPTPAAIIPCLKDTITCNIRFVIRRALLKCWHISLSMTVCQSCRVSESERTLYEV